MNRPDRRPDNPLDTRLLTGAVAALLVLGVVTGVQVLTRDVTWSTPVGLFAPIDMAGVLIATLVGGVVARQRRFRALAVLLQLVAAVCTLAIFLMFDTGMPAAMRAPVTLFKLNSLPLLVGLLLAYTGAAAGDRLAARAAPSNA